MKLLTGFVSNKTFKTQYFAALLAASIYKYICVMIINEIVNRIVFQQHIYITRYFAVLLTASTGVASLGPLLSKMVFINIDIFMENTWHANTDFYKS